MHRNAIVEVDGWGNLSNESVSIRLVLGRTSKLDREYNVCKDEGFTIGKDLKILVMHRVGIEPFEFMVPLGVIKDKIGEDIQYDINFG